MLNYQVVLIETILIRIARAEVFEARRVPPRTLTEITN